MLNPFQPKKVKTQAQLAAEQEAEKIAAIVKAKPPKASPPVPVRAVPLEEAGSNAGLAAGLAAVAAVAKAALPGDNKAFSASERAQATEVIQGVVLALPELLAVAIIDIDSGRAVASHTYDAAAFPVEQAVAYYAALVRQNRLAIAALELVGEHLEEVLITLRQQQHLMRVVNGARWLLYIAIEQREVNLAVAREVLRRHAI